MYCRVVLNFKHTTFSLIILVFSALCGPFVCDDVVCRVVSPAAAQSAGTAGLSLAAAKVAFSIDEETKKQLTLSTRPSSFY